MTTEIAVACRHWWLIKPAERPTSEGRCKRCGEKRDFENYVEHNENHLWPLGRNGVHYDYGG